MIRTACVLFFLIVLSSCSSSKNERVYYMAVEDANKAAAPAMKANPKEPKPKPHKITIRDAVLESLENNRVVLIFIEQEGIARANAEYSDQNSPGPANPRGLCRPGWLPDHGL